MTNIPNLLTFFRILLIPVFVILFYLPYQWSYMAAALVFILAAATDWFDGYLARKLNQSTAFGAFLDPLHVVVRQAEMMADFVDQHVADDMADGLVMLRPVVEDRPAVEEDARRLGRRPHGVAQADVEAVIEAGQLERILHPHLAQRVVADGDARQCRAGAVGETELPGAADHRARQGALPGLIGFVSLLT